MDYQDRIDDLIANRSTFDSIVYTPIDEALNALNERWKDRELEERTSTYLTDNVPESMIDGFSAVLSRHLVTPNYETRRFMIVPDVTGLKAVFFEYNADKFTSNNSLKYYLGKMVFHQGTGKNGGQKKIYENIIDFNSSNGKRIQDLKTLWGQNLVEFHHELMGVAFPNINHSLYDASDWFHKNGPTAKNYYRNFLSLFIRHGILFENFEINGSEGQFVRDVFLPAFFEVWKNTNVKPLIVALEPTNIEGDIFWLSHPIETKKITDSKKGTPMSNSKTKL